jgi:hypothetical protein
MKKGAYVTTRKGDTDEAIHYIRKVLKSKMYGRYCRVNMSLAPKYDKRARTTELQDTRMLLVRHQ